MVKFDFLLLLAGVAVLSAVTVRSGQTEQPSLISQASPFPEFRAFTLPETHHELPFTTGRIGGVGPNPDYYSNIVYPEPNFSVDGVQIGDSFEAVAAEHPDAIVERECDYPRCNVGSGKAHLLKEPFRVSSVDGKSVTSVSGTRIEGPSGRLLRVGMDAEATVAAMGYPHGGLEVGFGAAHGKAWRFMYPNKIVWVVFHDEKISAVSLSQIESEHRYFAGMNR